MLSRFTKAILTILFICSLCYGADEIINGFEDKDLPILNEELRKIGRRIDNNVIPSNYLQTHVQESIEFNTTNDTIHLIGDSSAPGNSQYYGTNGSGIKGWYATTSDPYLSHHILYTSNDTFVAPLGVTKVFFSMCGGGGGGGGSFGNPASGGGGGGNWIFRSAYNVIPGNSYTVTVGVGGTGGSGTGNTDGSAGGNTTFDLITVNGGTGGTRGQGGGAGGTGGAGNTTTFLAPAATAPNGQARQTYSGGDGAAGGGILGSGGGGGGSLYGAGGDGGALRVSGVGGTGFGSGGGGGGGADLGIRPDGGAGAQGFVLIEW